MKTTTQQPSRPFKKENKWFFTYFTLNGPRDYGPYPDEETANNESIKALRLHEANGYTDGDLYVRN